MLWLPCSSSVLLDPLRAGWSSTISGAYQGAGRGLLSRVQGTTPGQPAGIEVRRAQARCDRRPEGLSEVCRDVYIVRHNEDVSALYSTLESEGFCVHEVRGPYDPGMVGWSANTLCMVNHRNAWRRIVEGGVLAIVVEADFVPVRGFGNLPLPFDRRQGRDALGYLYAVGPQLWDLEGGLRGHAGGGVAYAVDARVARLLIRFAEEEILSASPERYMGWDSRLGYWLNREGAQTFLPYRNYGEHGGVSNPEHRQAGLRPHHRADLLAGPLAFLPTYAKGSRLRFWGVRLRGRTWGLLRLLAGRYLSWHDLRRSQRPAQLVRVALGRQFLRRAPGGLQ